MSYNWTNYGTVLETDLQQLRSVVENFSIINRCTANFVSVFTIKYSVDLKTNYKSDNNTYQVSQNLSQEKVNLFAYGRDKCAMWSAIHEALCTAHNTIEENGVSRTIDPFSNTGDTFRIIPPCPIHGLDVPEHACDTFISQQEGKNLKIIENYNFTQLVIPWQNSKNVNGYNSLRGCTNYFQELYNRGFLT